jgi:hypothetical protein
MKRPVRAKSTKSEFLIQWLIAMALFFGFPWFLMKWYGVG